MPRKQRKASVPLQFVVQAFLPSHTSPPPDDRQLHTVHELSSPATLRTSTTRLGFKTCLSKTKTKTRQFQDQDQDQDSTVSRPRLVKTGLETSRDQDSSLKNSKFVNNQPLKPAVKFYLYHI